MKQLAEFQLEGTNETVFVEIEAPAAGLLPVANPGDIAIKVGQSLEAALQKIKPAASAVVSALRDLADSPDEIKVEFGVKLSAKAGAILASADAEANYKVTLSWKSKSSSGSAGSE
jgi:Trypsin-co-occurring domain 1